jgi:[ribosomal protein S5]-alanine N-acetyltransferase
MKKFKPNAILLDGRQVYVRRITVADCNARYVRWMNAPSINQFLESRFTVWTIKNLREYIKKINQNKDSIFLAIIAKDTNKHIGNIKIGPINWDHLFAELGIVIGDKAYWGRGLATETIRLATEYCFKTLGLHKVTAGAYANNIGSLKAFYKAGFKTEGVRPRHFKYKNGYVGVVLLGKLRR